MTDTLFDLPNSPSPRRLWMERHNVSTRCDAGLTHPWCAWVGDMSAATQSLTTTDGADGDVIRTREFCTGQSEDDVLFFIAAGNGWKLWNEEARA